MKPDIGQMARDWLTLDPAAFDARWPEWPQWRGSLVAAIRRRGLDNIYATDAGLREALTDDEWADVVDVYGSFGRRLVADRIEAALGAAQEKGEAG